MMLNAGTTGHSVGFLDAQRAWDAWPRGEWLMAGSMGCAGGMATPEQAAA